MWSWAVEGLQGQGEQAAQKGWRLCVPRGLLSERAAGGVGCRGGEQAGRLGAPAAPDRLLPALSQCPVLCLH